MFYCSDVLFPVPKVDAQVKTGIDVLAEQDFDLLKGKRVGLVTNPTGVDQPAAVHHRYPFMKM